MQAPARTGHICAAKRPPSRGLLGDYVITVAFPAFFDACAYPAYVCETLLRLAEASAIGRCGQPTS
jgi:hypothetical protein